MEYPDLVDNIKQENVNIEIKQEEVSFELIEEESCLIDEIKEETVLNNEMKENIDEIYQSKKMEFINVKVEEEVGEISTVPPGHEADPMTLIPGIKPVLANFKMENDSIIRKWKRDALQEEDDILQIAGTHNPEIKKVNDTPQGGEMMDISENLKTEFISRKKEFARERSRKYRENIKKNLTGDEKTLRKRELERNRKRKYRESKSFCEKKDLTEGEKTSHKKELARERSRKYREKKRLEKFNSNVTHDSQITGPSRLPDNTRLPKQPTIHDSQVTGSSRMTFSPIHMDKSSEPVCCNFQLTDST